MRKITQAAVLAFINNQAINQGNTRVIYATKAIVGVLCYHYMVMRLLLKMHDTNNLYLTLAGWDTLTTKDRLNGLLHLSGFRRCWFHTKKGQAIVNSEHLYSINELMSL